jgi:hypothetical protein
LEAVAGYESFRRVTSDCKPWPAGGRLGVCRACGGVQNVLDAAWHADCARIYAGYTIYHQGAGAEQAVFEQGSGRAASRSARLLERVFAHVPLPTAGRLLDIGCGNGALLGAFGRFGPGWSLCGTEFNDKYRDVVRGLPGVEGFYTCTPDGVPGSFAMVSMIHVLEHIPQPCDFLVRLSQKLDTDGLLLIEVPDAAQNPFDLLIADHCSHFTPATLRDLLERAGYEVLVVADNWVPKEVTAVVRKSRGGATGRRPAPQAAAVEAAGCNLQWLGRVADQGRRLASRGNFGVFGTSIAGTWMYAELEGAMDFFVDEDPNRAGGRYLGRPVYSPSQAPEGADVLLALPAALARQIHARLEKGAIAFRCHLPPAA